MRAQSFPQGLGAPIIRLMIKPQPRGRPLNLSPMVTGFSRGLAQAVTGGASHRTYPAARDAAEALRGDWIKLGGDMRHVVARLRPRG